jgi:hypothetical protein
MLIGDEIVVTDNVDVVIELITLSHIAPELIMVLDKPIKCWPVPKACCVLEIPSPMV